MNNTGPGSPYSPDGKYDDPEYLSQILSARVLPLVSRPARYIGGELGMPPSVWLPEQAKILLAFPDAYEIGMSHTGLRVLASQLYRHQSATVDLVFAPWPDMADRMRAEKMPLFGLQTRRPVRQFDVVGFSLGYELTYTNLLSMLDLAGIPLLASERREGDPVIVAGGVCALNPMVLTPYIDVFCLGDGEDTIQEIADTVVHWRREGASRSDLCSSLANLHGAWRDGAEPTRGRLLDDLNNVPPPVDLVPVIEPVHDRLSLEVMRGCARGCRFCQAGMINRPVRERDVQDVVAAAVAGVDKGGWSEISLLSLSTSDYSGLADAVSGIQEKLVHRRTNLVVPSLRVDSVDEELYEWVSQEAPATFTFAPEAGSQRLRDVINKQVSAEDVLLTTRRAFASGAKKLKLYFMMGLPTETDEDLDDLIDLVSQVVELAPRGGAQVTVSISPFAPKPHTPFQWAGQIDKAEMKRRNRYLEGGLRPMRVKVSLRDPEVSALEALLSLGDAKVGAALLLAWQLGARFDGWTEWFQPDIWQQACAATGVEPRSYLDPRGSESALPWDAAVQVVDREFLQVEWDRALAGDTLPDCRLAEECYDCAACSGVQDHVFAASGEGLASEATERSSTAVRVGGDEAAGPAPFDRRNASREDPAREKRNWRIWRQQAASKCWYRAEYTKDGDICFLGHLDFQRQLQLALRRARLPVAYSQGFHPHPLLKFGPPLPVAVEGQREVLDIAFVGEQPAWENALNQALPPGLKVLGSVPLGAVVSSAIDRWVTRLDYRVVLPTVSEGGPKLEEVHDLIEKFMASKTWPYLRPRPKGDITVDARTLVDTDGLRVHGTADADPVYPGGTMLQVSLQRDPGQAHLPIHDFLAALLGGSLTDPRLCRIRRTGLYGCTAQGNWLTPLQEVGEEKRRVWLRQHLQS